MPTAVPMGTMSGKTPVQNEQPALGLNPAGADVGTGLAQVTRSPTSGGRRGAAAAGTGWAGRHGNQAVLLSLVLGVLTGRPDSTEHPRPWAPPRPLSLCPEHFTGTEMDGGDLEEKGEQMNQETSSDSSTVSHCCHDSQGWLLPERSWFVYAAVMEGSKSHVWRTCGVESLGVGDLVFPSLSSYCRAGSNLSTPSLPTYQTRAI